MNPFLKCKHFKGEVALSYSVQGNMKEPFCLKMRKKEAPELEKTLLLC
jgi:hypothetical protein